MGNGIRYRAVGDENAMTHFSVDETSGQIRVKKNLTLTFDTQFQVPLLLILAFMMSMVIPNYLSLSAVSKEIFL